jgi:hypothetical protein
MKPIVWFKRHDGQAVQRRYGVLWHRGRRWTGLTVLLGLLEFRAGVCNG